MKVRRTPATEVRSALIDAAHRVLRRNGTKGLTVRAVATEAGVAPMGVYNHFDGKDGLLTAVVSDGFTRLRDLTRAGTAGDARERLRDAGRRYREFAVGDPTLYRMMFSDQCSADPETAAQAFEALSELVRYGQVAGVIRDDDVLALTMQIWSCVHGAVSLEIDNAGPPEPLVDHAQNFELLLGLIERGVAPDA